MRCKHLHLEIIEFGDSYTSHERDKISWTHTSDFGDYGRMIEVTCHNCGFHARFGKRRPQWVQIALAEAIIEAPDPLPEGPKVDLGKPANVREEES